MGPVASREDAVLDVHTTSSTVSVTFADGDQGGDVHLRAHAPVIAVDGRAG